MKLFIKNMVSTRCKMAVKKALTELKIKYSLLELGEVSCNKALTIAEQEHLKVVLAKSGLELMANKKADMLARIKGVILELILSDADTCKIKNSKYISDKMQMEYHQIAHFFMMEEEMTLEHYIIEQKVEQVKYLLICDELNLTQISYKLHYSSVSHLSAQFKKITNLTPKFFKAL